MKRITVPAVCLALVLLVSSAFLAGPSPALANGFTDDADAIEKAADSVFMLEIYSANHQQIAVGSGFVAFDPAILVTNYHVIEGGAYVIAVSDEKEQFLVSRICCYDKKKDIAILMFDNPGKAEPLALNTDEVLKRSQPVVAIGSPAGLMNTVSIGNISAFYTQGGKDWIQFTAPISSGSSGGALFNDNGKIIGITTATYASAQNVNMAVKIGEVIRLYDRWDKKTTTAMGRTYSMPAVPSAGLTSSEKESKVWVTASGKKYHNTPYCSKMRSPIEMDLLEAIERGFTPCGKCYK